jgi:hypothetical protein
MIYRVGAAFITSVVVIACSVAGTDMGAGSPPVLSVMHEAATTIEAVQQAVYEPVRRAPSIVNTHTVPASTSSVLTGTTIGSVNPIQSMTASTVTISSLPNDLLHRRYSMYERGGDVVALQTHLGLESVDGIYGPITRAAHIEGLGGTVKALYLWFPELRVGVMPCSHGCEPGDEHYELPTLGELVDHYFLAVDREWALRVAFCESSAQPDDVGSDKMSSALAVGWFQHLARYWSERSEKAGWGQYEPFHAEANVAVAAWLFYEGGGPRHWNPSRTCWEKENDGTE